MRAREPVAITGIGCLCAAGLNMETCLETSLRGVCEPAPPSRFNTDHEVAYPVFEVNTGGENHDATIYGDLLRTTQLALMATAEALEDAHLGSSELGDLRAGVVMGTTVGSAMNNEAFYRRFRNGEHPEMEPIKRYLKSNPASSLAEFYGLNGPCQTVVNACSSGADAIGIGADWIRSGICDVVLAGGADELCRVTYDGFISLMITDESPCRPFDVNRNGLNLGEGASVMILESPFSLKRRNRNPRAYLRGYASESDAHHLTGPHPDGRGLRRALDHAIKESGCDLNQLAFIHAHGTGTRDNDRVEAKVLADMLSGIPFLSTKGLTGHTLGAAGALGAAFAVGFLERGQVPASAGFSKRDAELEAEPTWENVFIQHKTALTESLAFGGHNAVLLFSLEGPT